MNRLTILYDAACGLCFRAKVWMLMQPAYVSLEFLPAASSAALRRYPQLATRPEELVAIDDSGGVYRGDHAWVMALWALREWRPLATRLASPRLQPLARGAWKFISENRRQISTVLALESEATIAARLGATRAIACAEEPAGGPR